MNNETTITTIVNELCDMEPALRDKREELSIIVAKLLKNQPADIFDKAFARRLREQLVQTESTSFMSLFNSRLGYGLSGAAIALVFMLPVAYLAMNPAKPGSTDLVSSLGNTQVFNSRPTNAFGSLASLAVATMERTQSGGGNGNPASPISMDAKMIAPYFMPYKFVYAGEALDLSETQLDVYRRIKGLSSQAVSSMVAQLGQPLLNLSSFPNAQVRSIDIYEPSGKGYSVNVNFLEGTANISANYEQWFAQVPPQLRLEEIPSDSELLAIAAAFVSQRGMDVSGYGQPIVDSSWRTWYEQSEDKAKYYFPDTYPVVYPILVNGSEVRDSSGAIYGLRLDVHAREKQVFSAWNLTTQQYDASGYAIEQDSARILKFAERGGMYSWWNEPAQDAKEITLGTPTRILLQHYRYTTGVNEELYVPALMFPVVDAPTDMYVQPYVIVPIVKEVLDAQEQQVIMPFVREGLSATEVPSPVVSEPSLR